jgi:HSP20 family protein
MIPEFENLLNRMWNWPVMEMPERLWGLTTEELENEFVIRAELPGFAPEEVNVEVVGNRLTIAAEHKVPAETKEAPEREHTRVHRIMTLPAVIVPEKIEATFRNGVLEVHVPRSPAATARRIEVKT